MIFDMTVLCYFKKLEQQILANCWNLILQLLLSLQALAINLVNRWSFLAEKYLLRTFPV